MLLQKTRHDRHPVEVRINVDSGHHYASLHCAKCDAHIQWLSRTDADQLISLQVPPRLIYDRKVKSKFKL